MKTTANATVDHLSKYLALRIALEERQTDGQRESAGAEGGGEAGAGGEERGGGGGEGAGLRNVSEKQYTIYITTSGGQFSVSWHGDRALPKMFFLSFFFSPCSPLPSPQTLNGSLTLELVNEKYWKVRKPLELYYAPTKDQPQQTPRQTPSQQTAG